MAASPAPPGTTLVEPRAPGALAYRIHVPAEHQGGAVVLLHGLGGDENRMWVFRRVVPAGFVTVAPRGTTAVPGGGFAWRLRAPDEWPAVEDFAPATTALAAFVERLAEDHHVAPGRVIWVGFSQGAAVAFALAMTRRDIVAAVASIAGFVPLTSPDRLRARPLSGLPAFLAEGTRDTLVPPSVAERSARDLATAGAAVARRAYPVGHKLSAQGARDLAAWVGAVAARSSGAGEGQSW